MSPRHFPRSAIFCCLVGLVSCFVDPVARGAEPADEPRAKPQVDPQAQTVIDAFGKYLRGLEGFRVGAKVTLSIEQQGQKQDIEFAQSFSAQRPNKLAYTLESAAAGGATVVSDGDQVTVYMKAFNRYLVEKAPDSWQALTQNQLILGVLGPGNATPATTAILSDDPAARLLEKVRAVKYGGLVELGDTKCHLIQATGEEMDWQMWIDAGERPLVRQFVPDLNKLFERMAKQVPGNRQVANIKATNVVVFSDWQANPKFDAEAFVFHAPEGADKVDSLAALVGRGNAEASAPHPLLGKAAPPVKLDLLEGGALDLAAYKGKKVVMLDFWATWCGPCVQAMPIIDKVAEEYKAKGVLLFAVNIEEQPDDIRAFLKDAGLEVDVALDKDGATAKAYGASAIPQTVLIGKDGSVQVVHVGLSANLEQELTQELEALLAGKDLAAQALVNDKAE